MRDLIWRHYFGPNLAVQFWLSKTFETILYFLERVSREAESNPLN